MSSRSFRISLAIAAALAVVPAGAFARGHATPTPAPTAVATPTLPPENPAITALARREFVAWQAGTVDPTHYALGTRLKLTAEKIADTSKALGRLGPLSSVEWLGFLGIEDGPPGVTGYIYKMNCERASVYEELTIGPDGKIDGIMFRDSLQQQQ